MVVWLSGRLQPPPLALPPLELPERPRLLRPLGEPIPDVPPGPGMCPRAANGTAVLRGAAHPGPSPPKGFWAPRRCAGASDAALPAVRCVQRLHASSSWADCHLYDHPNVAVTFSGWPAVIGLSTGHTEHDLQL